MITSVGSNEDLYLTFCVKINYKVKSNEFDSDYRQDIDLVYQDKINGAMQLKKQLNDKNE